MVVNVIHEQMKFHALGGFTLNLPPAQGGYSRFANFAAMQRAGIETHGLLLTAPVFASGLTPLASYTVTLDPPDLGALELGGPAPLYGPRPEGIDESDEPLGCEKPGNEYSVPGFPGFIRGGRGRAWICARFGPCRSCRPGRWPGRR